MFMPIAVDSGRCSAMLQQLLPAACLMLPHVACCLLPLASCLAVLAMLRWHINSHVRPPGRRTAATYLFMQQTRPSNSSNSSRSSSEAKL